jgi:DNA-binding LacI/PurR family transcriptional regulator
VRIVDLGRRAFERLVAEIDGNADGARINEQLACELVVRQSTGKTARVSGDTS